MALPRVMVAPNGARLTKADHPNIPITIAEVVATAKDCFAAGADGLHFHLRDDQGKHLLDAGRYREALGELAVQVPNIYAQITSEAAGRYDPAHQMAVVLQAEPGAVSVSVREMLRCDSIRAVQSFYDACEERHIDVQHILYDRDDVESLINTLPTPLLEATDLKLLFVLGSYAKNRPGQPDDLTPFLTALNKHALAADWAVCAFGQTETACLRFAAQNGGKLRVGFENALLNEDGSTAANNAERVRKVRGFVKNPKSNGTIALA